MRGRFAACLINEVARLRSPYNPQETQMREQLNIGTGTAPGTCGELAQGFTADGQPFHVTCPINRYATATVRLQPSAEWSFGSTDADATKLRRSIKATAGLLGVGPFAVAGRHWTDLDTSKGLGSSTADILAGSRALAQAVGRELTPEQEAQVTSSIGRTGGAMFPAITAFRHLTGKVLDTYAWTPQFAVTMLVPDADLLTADVDFTGKQKHAPTFKEMLASLQTASAERDGKAFASAATRSALLNQEWVENEWVPLLDSAARGLHADGVIVGHTGTVAGLLFLLPDGQRGRSQVFRQARKASRALRQMLPTDVSVHTVRTLAR
jgi:L-threonine kinase